MMKINQPTLSAALSKCAQIAKSSRGQLPILSTVRMEARSGRLSLWATDLNQFSVQHVECEGELEPVCVGVGRLQTVIAGQKELTIDKNASRLFIHGNNSKSELAFLDVEEFGGPPDEKFTDIGVNCADLAACLRKVAWASNRMLENDRLIFESVHVQLSAKRMMCEAFNGVKFAKVARPAICADADFLVHYEKAKAFTESVAMPDAVLAVSENRVRVTHAFGVDYYKLSEGQYPDTDRMLPKADAYVPIGAVPVDWLKQQCEICLSLASEIEREKYSDVVIETTTGTLTISTQNSAAEHKAELKGEFVPARVKVGAENLLAGLRSFGESNPTLSVRPRERIRLHHGDLEVLISVMREDQPKDTK